MNSKDDQELYGIDGEPLEFEWNIFPGYTTLELLHEIHKKWRKKSGIKQEKFRDWIIFVSSCDDIDWSRGDENFKKCKLNSTEVKNYANRFPKGHWAFLSPGTEEK